jgi:hypothetical protein
MRRQRLSAHHSLHISGGGGGLYGGKTAKISWKLAASPSAERMAHGGAVSVACVISVGVGIGVT